VTTRRDFLRQATIATAGLYLGCRPDRLISPCPNGYRPLPYQAPTPGFELPPPARQIWIANTFGGQQLGTRDNPFQVGTTEWDSFMKQATSDPTPAGVHARDSHFTSRACYEWGPIESPWRLPSGWQLDGHGSTTLELDPNVPDSYVQSPHLHLICTAEGYSTWDALPVGQTVRGFRFVANHSKLADRWKALGANLLPSAMILSGHAAQVEDIELVDFGALGGEAFPIIICGAMAGPDRHALSILDPSSHVFDSKLGLPRTHISRVKFTGFNPSASNAQITVTAICGMVGAQTIPADHWEELPPWTQLWRTNKPYISDVEGNVPGSAKENQVQLATIYQCTEGEIANVRGSNVLCLAYGDYYSTKNLHVHHLLGRQVLRGVAQFLSPTPRPLADLFSAEGLTVTDSDVETLSIDVTYHGGVVLDSFTADYAAQGGMIHRQIKNTTISRCKLPSVKAVDIDGLTITDDNEIGRIQTVRCTNISLSSCN
jgi:hypothetical protein